MQKMIASWYTVLGGGEEEDFGDALEEEEFAVGFLEHLIDVLQTGGALDVVVVERFAFVN